MELIADYDYKTVPTDTTLTLSIPSQYTGVNCFQIYGCMFLGAY